MTVSSTVEAKQRFSQLAHWGYGTEQAMLPKLRVSPPATEWGAEEVAIDLWHHLVDALATALAHEWLESR